MQRRPAVFVFDVQVYGNVRTASSDLPSRGITSLVLHDQGQDCNSVASGSSVSCAHTGWIDHFEFARIDTNDALELLDISSRRNLKDKGAKRSSRRQRVAGEPTRTM